MGDGDTGKDVVAETDGGVVYRTDLAVGKICAMIEKAGIHVCVASGLPHAQIVTDNWGGG